MLQPRELGRLVSRNPYVLQEVRYSTVPDHMQQSGRFEQCREGNSNNSRRLLNFALCFAAAAALLAIAAGSV